MYHLTIAGRGEGRQVSSKVTFFPTYAQITEVFLLQLLISSFQYWTEFGHRKH